MATIAEQIAERFNNNGQQWVDADGEHIETACNDEGQYEAQGETARYEFFDGSAIVITGGGWDIGFDAADVEADERKRFAWPACYSDLER